MEIKHQITGHTLFTVNAATLQGADLSSANLRRAKLSAANLSDADLSDADLSKADLSGANLRSADLSRANLSGANLHRADLHWAYLSGADLNNANLYGANLSGADLRWAYLSGADLSGANLSRADLSGTVGLLSAITWLQKNCEKTVDGYIVHKRIGDTPYQFLREWKIESGVELHEVCNPNRITLCGCGVNFGTRAWCDVNHTNATLWSCLIKWEWLPGVVVPFNTDGKARCERLQLTEKVKTK